MKTSSLLGTLTFEPCESDPTTVCVCVCVFLLSVVELEYNAQPQVNSNVCVNMLGTSTGVIYSVIFTFLNQYFPLRTGKRSSLCVCVFYLDQYLFAVALGPGTDLISVLICLHFCFHSIYVSSSARHPHKTHIYEQK